MVDPYVRHLREDLRQVPLQDVTALEVRGGAGGGEARPAAEGEAVVGGDAEVVAYVLGVHAPAIVGDELPGPFLAQQLGEDDEAAGRWVSRLRNQGMALSL
jgi:hypothetical protein